MKKYYYHILTVLLSSMMLLACSDNDYAELNKGNNVLTLTADQATSELNEASHASDAITLNWTTGTNYGTGSRIYYTLEIATSGSNFADAHVIVDHETQVYSWNASHEALNTLLLNHFGAVAGQTVNLEARVTATTDGGEAQTSSLSFSASPYTPVTSTLYLVGDATPNGWNADNATEMKRTDNGKFTWEGTLRAGSLKFLTTLGEWIPSYNKAADGSLVLRNSFDEPDEQWQITEPHFYKISVDLLNHSISIIMADGETPAFDNLYFVGQPTGWGFVQMTKDPLDPFLFRYNRYFDQGDGGEFKFGTAAGSWENMLKATQPNAPYTDTSMSFIKGYDPDNKWFLKDSETGKAYKICVDIRTNKERMMMREFVPYQMIYLVGDATPNGWDIGNATPMMATDNPYVFTWAGNLTAGELKFTCDKKSDWNGAWFMNASGNGVAPTGEVENMLFIDKSDDYFKSQYLDFSIGDVDQKWKITSAGHYTITLNQLDETISIVKQ